MHARIKNENAPAAARVIVARWIALACGWCWEGTSHASAAFPHFCGQHFDVHISLVYCMPTRAIIMSSEDDGDGGDADWISAKDSKETRDSRHASALCRVVLLLV